MPLQLPAATAEQVVSAVEAAIANSGSCTKEFAAAFSDIAIDRVAAALDLACELGLLAKVGEQYQVANPVAKLIRSPHVEEKAAVMRVALEQFRPFVVFRQELDATGDPSIAATRAKAMLDLVPHREDIKSTLLGLATFSGALKAAAAGKYERDVVGIASSLSELASGATEKAAAVHQVRTSLGAAFANELSQDDVVEG